MKKLLFVIVTITMVIAATAGATMASPDLYMGDTAIYSANASGVKPNVLFVIDNSAGMTQAGVSQAYDPTKTYPGPYTASAVYVRESATGGTINYNQYIASVNSVSCPAARQALVDGTDIGNTVVPPPGAYYGYLKKSDGSCNAQQSGNYYLGNFLNYLTPPLWQANHDYNVGDVILSTRVGGYSYICTQAGQSGARSPNWPNTLDTPVTDNGAVWVLRPNSVLEMVQGAVNGVAAKARDIVNVGLMVFGNNNHGAQVLQPVRDISNGSANGPANFATLANAVNNITLLGSNLQPINEALWDAGVYYRGQNSSSLEKIAADTAAYPSPIQNSCQPNFIIVLTTGNSDGTSHTSQHLTDLYVNGTAGDAADAAKYNWTTDNSATLGGTQVITTAIIQLLSVQVPILSQAANVTGKNFYYNVWSHEGLVDALDDLLNNIVAPYNTSFVAPVVPVSPENRTYSGSRVYMGFFKPISQRYWNGNLKKYGINSQNNIIDANGNVATYVDIDGNRIDDLSGATLPSGATNGTFKIAAQSYWSADWDGGVVEEGGAGGKLVARNLSTNPRKIYTYMGTNNNLTDASNAFTTTNTDITAATLDVGVAEKNNLINFVHGFDAYDEDGNGNTTEKRGKFVTSTFSLADGWIMGDILHSKPLIVNYASYTFTGTNESDCNVNKTMTYVGANDGLLHAFKDCDGSEAWAFIPPDMLGNLQYMHTSAHAYYVDSSPSVYIYDHNHNGIIETGDGDKVILILGERRGGGADSSPTKGAYYALDVSDPATPTYLWKVDSATSGFPELAESWSEPKIVQMNIGGSTKIVAFVGAGYDNANEDGRYGATQTFSGTGTVSLTDIGKGIVTSSGTSSQSNPRGRGIYAIEIATLNSGVPNFTNSGVQRWGFTNADFSFPAEISALDMNNDGYVDRLYAADTGGNIWRFNVENTSPASWAATKIFSSNPGSGGSTDTGRKIFYKMSSVVEPGNVVMLFFGTGDREHPLNRGNVDRLYALKDKDQSSVMTESNMLDVTTDQLQTTTVTSGPGSIADILDTLNASANYGWYIKLNENSGEKVLAPPTVFNKVAYFTTYAPSTAAVPDPCNPDLGTARIYAVDYKTGEAVLNYDTSNDTYSTTNKRALSTPGQVLVRSDRLKTIGSGIPSGIVLIINPNGGLKALIGVGGVIPGENPKRGGSIIPLYWRQK